MKFEHTQVWGLEHALRGMRNPKESWGKSDSEWMFVEDPSLINPEDEWKIVIGPNDMELALRLIRAGSVHRKFLRQIFVSVDITAPIFWWKEFDTYKVGTTANSTSTMHKLASTPITRQCFELDDYHGELQLIDPVSLDIRTNCFIEDLEQLRQLYLQTKDKKYWKELIRWLPSGWLQTRTVTMTYENLVAMCSQDQRRHHKLSEWRESFVEWARTLPYMEHCEEVYNEKNIPSPNEIPMLASDPEEISFDSLDAILSELVNLRGYAFCRGDAVYELVA